VTPETPANDSQDTRVALDEIVERLRRCRSETLETIDLLRSSKLMVESNSHHLENPKAVLEYIDFFLDVFARTAVDLERLGSELPEGPAVAHLDLLRQLASNASAEQRRCLIFRDKWINKPLPVEQMRPLLNQISTDSRDQLAEYRTLQALADRLAALEGPAPKPSPEEGKLGRRELFTRWFGK
jgi:hypothetical protein